MGRYNKHLENKWFFLVLLLILLLAVGATKAIVISTLW